MKMAEGKDRKAWLHTSSLLAMFYNVNCDRKRGKLKAPSDFNPYIGKAKPKVMLKGKQLTILRDIFCSPKSK